MARWSKGEAYDDKGQPTGYFTVELVKPAGDDRPAIELDVIDDGASWHAAIIVYPNNGAPEHAQTEAIGFEIGDYRSALLAKRAGEKHVRKMIREMQAALK